MPYQFKPGERTKFKTFDDYTCRQLNPWAWLIVDSTNDSGWAKVRLEEEKSETILDVQVKDLTIPFGYEDVYEAIVDSPTKAKMVLSWFANRGGVAVWVCVDLSSRRIGSKKFSPATSPDGVPVDKNSKPHWSDDLLEVVTDPKRLKIMIEYSRDTKPDVEDKRWTWDKGHKEWYRREEWKQE